MCVRVCVFGSVWEEALEWIFLKSKEERAGQPFPKRMTLGNFQAVITL